MTMRSIRTCFAVAAGLSCGFAHADTFIQVSSQASHVIYPGTPTTVGPPTRDLSAAWQSGGGARISTTPGPYFWSFDFMPLDGDALKPGSYGPAFSGAARAGGLSLSGNVSCPYFDGAFTVHEVGTAADGTISSFAADFVAYCAAGYSGVYGGIRFNSSIPYVDSPPPPPPTFRIALTGQPPFEDHPGKLDVLASISQMYFFYGSGTPQARVAQFETKGNVPLVPGVYSDASFSVWSVGASCQGTRFTVRERQDAQDGRIANFVADVECDAPAGTTGTVEFKGWVPYSVPPFRTAPPAPVITNVRGTSPSGRAMNLFLTPAVAGCTLSSAGFNDPRDRLSFDVSPGIAYPYGMVDFRADHCGDGQSVTLSIDFPEELPPTAQWWMYGRTPENRAARWYAVPATVSGKTITFTISDGGVGDDDLMVNGSVTGLGMLAIPGGPMQDLWWSGAAENGWGMSIIQHRDVLFANVFVYDAHGSPVWYVMPSGSWNETHTTYEGALYLPKASPYYAYDASKFDIGASVGTARLAFSGVNGAAFDYVIDGITGRKQMTRLPFGPAAAPTDTPLGDLWWGGVGQNGWGVAIIQQHSSLFGLWFTYDAAGAPTWFVMSDVEFVAKGIYRGPIYKTQGSGWLGAPYDASVHRTQAIGNFILRFDGDSTTFDYSFDTNTPSSRGSSVLTRIPF